MVVRRKRTVKCICGAEYEEHLRGPADKFFNSGGCERTGCKAFTDSEPMSELRPKPVGGATGAREFYRNVYKATPSDHEAYMEFAEAYASSQLKKLDGVAQQAAEEFGKTCGFNTLLQQKIAAIISKLIAERLSK